MDGRRRTVDLFDLLAEAELIAGEAGLITGEHAYSSAWH